MLSEIVVFSWKNSLLIVHLETSFTNIAIRNGLPAQRGDPNKGRILYTNIIFCSTAKLTSKLQGKGLLETFWLMDVDSTIDNTSKNGADASQFENC